MLSMDINTKPIRNTIVEEMSRVSIDVPRRFTKKKKDNPRFIDDKTIPLVQDKDYDDYITPNTSRVDENVIHGT